MRLGETEETLRLTSYHGGIALVGDAMLEAHQKFASDIPLPKRTLHITLVTAGEYKSIDRSSVSELALAIPLTHVYALGEASSSKSTGSIRWIVVVWNHADVWRRSVGLAKKDYHITLTDENDHVVNKSIGSLALERSPSAIESLVRYIGSLGLDAMDHAAAACDGNAVPLAISIAESMIVSHPTSYKGYIRLAEATLTSHPKTSMLAYAQAVRLNASLLPKVTSRLKRLSDVTPYGSTVTAEERDDIRSELRPHLLCPFPLELDQALSSVSWTAPTETRHRSTHNGYELPRNFSWLYPGRLAGMSTPKSESDIDALIDIGFTHILTLTAEEPLDARWFRLKPVEHVFIPVENYGAPTIQEMQVIFDRVRAGGTWLVHCGGGVGRAGTVLACMASTFGTAESDDDSPQLDSKEAIKLIRRARPRSLESERQEIFVQAWVSHRWKMAHQAQGGPREPVTVSRAEYRPGVTIMDLARSTGIMLIGKPGSGKSWLSTAISKRRQGKTVIVSQDESRSRQGCERTWGSKHSDDTLVILDRCNPTAQDRKYWLSLCLAQHLVAIFFDYPLELCQQRVDHRIDHPRIRAGKGANALAQMDKDMCKPTMSEGFSAIYTVSSFSAAREVVRALAGDPPLLKFPRTPHLLDLGATTSDDIVQPDFEALDGRLTIEEKIDGANLGFSIDWDGAIRCQNRSHWISSADHAQFKPLGRWIEEHDTALRRILDRDPHYPERYILYGEWMVAKHSIHYTALPDKFIAFDLYDRLEETFLSRSKLSLALRGSGISQVPLLLNTEQITRSEILRMLHRKSAWAGGLLEGVYIRIEDDERTTTVGRGKIVRSDFIAGNEHWSKGRVTLNLLSDDATVSDV